MKWLDRMTGNTPEVKAAVDAEKARLKQEGDAMLAKIAADSAARRAEISKAHEESVAAIDGEINRLKGEMADTRKEAMMNTAFMRFRGGVLSRLQMALARETHEDPRAAMYALSADFEEKLGAVQKNPSAETMNELETWVVAKAGERHVAAVEDEFTNLRERLREQGIALD